jgi:succinoglycan biosynthesis protein ExoM
MDARPTRHVTVCVCTFRRPQLLRKLLEELAAQETGGEFTFSAVVSDNDSEQSARAMTEECSARLPYPIEYVSEPRQNIALARNMALSKAGGDYIACIDDDEYPAANWLLSLLRTCDSTGADGVLGPVKPYFETEPPRWAIKGRFFDRPSHATGYRIGLSDARTGNVLFKRSLIAADAEVFKVEFKNGGEDVDFFRRKMAAGAVFVWCDEAPVFEIVPLSRSTRGYLLRRAMLRGRNSFRQKSGRLANVVKSAVAAPLYIMILPFLYLAGEHHGLKFLIKLCDHGGRLLALVGLNPVRERDL